MLLGVRPCVHAAWGSVVGHWGARQFLVLSRLDLEVSGSGLRRQTGRVPLCPPPPPVRRLLCGLLALGNLAVDSALLRRRILLQLIHLPTKSVGASELDGIRPFTMPLMKLACTALERVPLTRAKIIDNLMQKFHQDLVFCRAPDDNELTKGVHEKQKEKIDPILDWVNTEFGIKPVLYTSFLGGKQDEGLARAVATILKDANDCELASIDAMAAAAHSLVIPLAIFRGRLGIEEALELIRLEEDLQVDRWGLVEGGHAHDVDIADLKVQMSSAVVFLQLSWRQ